MKTWNPQYKTLDHWRGFAALWVLAFHGFAAYGTSFHPLTEIFVQKFATYGSLGVHLFFVISGYCIAASAYKLVARKSTVKEFIENRLWRVFPTYWAALIVAIVINLIASRFNGTTIWDNLPTSWQFWVGHIFLAQPYLGVENYVGVYWTLTVEIAFYLIVAFLLIIYKNIDRRLAIFSGLALGVCSIFVVPGFRITFLNYWCEFVCGCLLFSALWSKNEQKILRRNLSLILIVVLGILGIWVNFSFHSTDLWFSAMFAICLYPLYSFDTKIDAIKPLNWLKYIGIFSYSLYLIHVPFQENIINLGLRYIQLDSIWFLLLQIPGWIIPITASYIFFRLIEKPMIQWRHHQRNLKKAKAQL
jgi:peptidoglycan/LPS O-acetylase OafA/YrhL